MIEYTADRPLISIHIPKCAGTSFSRILKQWFGSGFATHYHDERRNRAPRKQRLKRWFPPGQYRRGVCIHGHFNHRRGNGVEAYYPEVNQFITIVRDPFELHLSNYFYVRHQAASNQLKLQHDGKLHPILENNWSLEDYLYECPDSYLTSFLPSEITLENHAAVMDRKFVFVGLVEELQWSVDMLATMLGFQSAEVPLANISERSEVVPEGAKQAFSERNPLATAVYQYALANRARILASAACPDIV